MFLQGTDIIAGTVRPDPKIFNWLLIQEPGVYGLEASWQRQGVNDEREADIHMYFQYSVPSQDAADGTFS